MFSCCIGTLFVSFNLVYGYNSNNYKYIISTTNTCMDSCDVNSLSLIQCSIMCTQVQGCQGVTLNINDSNCCVCFSIGVPTQSVDPGNVFYRRTRNTSLTMDMVAYVSNSQITASSVYDAYNSPSRGRLNTPDRSKATERGAWVAGSNSPYTEYIQVQFDDLKQVFEIGTQGRSYVQVLQCVTSYQVTYSVDCSTFSIIKDTANVSMIFPGNNDRNTIVWNALPEPALAVCVRISPITYIEFMALRFGVKGRNAYP